MAGYVLIPGAASGPWYRHLLEAELRGQGHDVVAVDLPCDEDSAWPARTPTWWSDHRTGRSH